MPESIKYRKRYSSNPGVSENGEVHKAILIPRPKSGSDFPENNTNENHKIETIVFDQPEVAYITFMKASQCYNIIPNASKLVTFDTELQVKKAFYALVANSVRAAPLWDNELQEFTGMLTITDFIQILCKYYVKNGEKDRIHEIEEHKISTWKKVLEESGHGRKFVTISPRDSLYDAVEMLCDEKIHRLPAYDQHTGDVLYIITHKRIMKYLYLYMEDLPKPQFMSQTPKELSIGTWGNIWTISYDTPVIEALRLFLVQRISALPIIDSNNTVVDIYSKFDVIYLAAGRAYNDLDVPVREALKYREEWFEGVYKCSTNDDLYTVIEAIVKAEVHRIIVTNEDGSLAGIVSLSDILKFLVLDSPAVKQNGFYLS